MDPDVPLIVPQVNSDHLHNIKKNIIANPNCSTIQMVLALNPLHKRYGLERIIVSTYQSITGTGVKAMQQLQNEEQGLHGAMAYPYPIYRNCLPHCDDFTSTGYTKEEMKLSNETQKILDSSISVSATAVRIPVVGGHSESINIELENSFDIADITQLLKETSGVTVKDDINNLEYPMPLYSKNKDDVFVGRIRKDFSHEKALNLWVVADNLRKGAATNAVQIAEKIITDFL